MVWRERQIVRATRDDRLAFLLCWAEVWATNYKPYDQRRKQKGRWSWRKLKLATCWVCGKAKTLVRHHIIQVKNGGGNDARNIVAICQECHLEVHPWMDAADHPILAEVRAMDARQL